jgi:hypothetical protein
LEVLSGTFWFFRTTKKAISRDPGLLGAHEQGPYEMLYDSTPEILVIAVASLHDCVVSFDWPDIDVLAFTKRLDHRARTIGRLERVPVKTVGEGRK